MHQPVRNVERKIWREDALSPGLRAIPEETAIALTYNGGTYAVMMATPRDLADFALGFSLSEGIVQSPADIGSLDIVDLDDGIELRMWLRQSRADRLNERRRHIAGPTGCGICGIDSIAEAVRPAAIVAPGGAFSPREIMTAMQGITALQAINIETRAVHAAAFWAPTRGIVALREDVGRHNALDKVIGALTRAGIDCGTGYLVITSRASYEMVQKAATVGIALLAAVSAPTALAIRLALETQLTLVGFARAHRHVVYANPQRLLA